MFARFEYINLPRVVKLQYLIEKLFQRNFLLREQVVDETKTTLLQSIRPRVLNLGSGDSRGPWMWFTGLIGFAHISIATTMITTKFQIFIATFFWVVRSLSGCAGDPWPINVEETFY